MEYTVSDLQSLPAEVRDEAWRRYRLILPLLRLHPKERTRMTIEAYAHQQMQKQHASDALLSHERTDLARRRQQGLHTSIDLAVSHASIERWLHAFERSGQDIRALAPATNGPGGTSLFDGHVGQNRTGCASRRHAAVRLRGWKPLQANLCSKANLAAATLVSTSSLP